MERSISDRPTPDVLASEIRVSNAAIQAREQSLRHRPAPQPPARGGSTLPLRVHRFSRREDAPSRQQDNGQRPRRARRVSQQQKRAALARALDRGSRQDQAQDRPGARRP